MSFYWEIETIDIERYQCPIIFVPVNCLFGCCCWSGDGGVDDDDVCIYVCFFAFYLASVRLFSPCVHW